MFTFHWSDLVTPDLLDRIRRPLGVEDASDIAMARPALARILEAAGGLAVVDRVPDPAAQLDWAIGLLHEAIQHTISTAGYKRSTRGYTHADSRIPELESVIVGTERVPVNRASASAIAREAAVADGLADHIVQERRARGLYLSFEDFDRRLSGVNIRNRERIANVIQIDAPEQLLRRRKGDSGTFAADLRYIVALHDGMTVGDRCVAALETVAAVCAAEPHPATRLGRRREPAAQVDDEMTDVDWVGVLFGSDYYPALVEMLAAATKTIDVCMFHIALPGDNHPTRKVLEALRDAHARHVKVRVMVDRDRRDDPYHSTVINARARAMLQEARVPVRSDRADRLLHSKFLVIDGRLAVIGSHNWSEGSYFEFDDLTLVLASSSLAGTMTRRFETLWSGGGE